MSTSTSTSTTPSLHIDIVSDSVCPWCYIGKRRLEQALKQLSPTVKISKKFQPFFLDPTAPVGQSVNKLQRYYSKFGGKARVDSMINNMKATGQQLGINFSYGGNTGSTLQSHRLIEYAENHGKQDDVVNALFKAYFENEQDITQDEVLVKIASDAGMNAEDVRTFLKTHEYEDSIKEKVEENYQRGITGVPFFIINNKYAVSGAQTPDVFLDIFQKRLGLPLRNDSDSEKAIGGDESKDNKNAPVCDPNTPQNC